MFSRGQPQGKVRPSERIHEIIAAMAEGSAWSTPDSALTRMASPLTTDRS